MEDGSVKTTDSRHIFLFPPGFPTNASHYQGRKLSQLKRTVQAPKKNTISKEPLSMRSQNGVKKAVESIESHSAGD